MNKIFGVWENDIEDITLVASFYIEVDANKCAEYLNDFKRKYKNYYVEEIELYKSFSNYLIDVKSS